MVEQETQHKQIYANILQLDDYEEEIERVEPLVDKQESNPSFEGHERIEEEEGSPTYNLGRRDSFALKKSQESQGLDKNNYQSSSIHPTAFTPFGTASAWDQIHSDENLVTQDISKDLYPQQQINTNSTYINQK